LQLHDDSVNYTKLLYFNDFYALVVDDYVENLYVMASKDLMHWRKYSVPIERKWGGFWLSSGDFLWFFNSDEERAYVTSDLMSWEKSFEVPIGIMNRISKFGDGMVYWDMKFECSSETMRLYQLERNNSLTLIHSVPSLLPPINFCNSETCIFLDNDWNLFTTNDLKKFDLINFNLNRTDIQRITNFGFHNNYYFALGKIGLIAYSKDIKTWNLID